MLNFKSLLCVIRANLQFISQTQSRGTRRMVRCYSERELNKGPLTTALRHSRKPRPAHAVGAMSARTHNAPTPTDVEPFGEREFETLEAFFEAVHVYEEMQCVKFSTRDSQSREESMRKAIDARQTAVLPIDETFLQTLLPESMPFSFKRFQCVHGRTQKTRGKNKRYRAASMYTGCEARLTLRAIKREDGKIVYRTMDEVNRHNHKCTAVVYNSYQRGCLIEDRDLFIQVCAMVNANAPTKNICDVVGMLTGKAFTTQQLANFKRDHMGGNSAFENLRYLVTKFSNFDGSSCLVVDDDDGRILGIVFQSSAQRAVFDMWGDNLIMDFTHNTNNAGYYLGSLMVTSVTGKGVSVADFLVVEQSEAMMERVIEHFIRTNPSAVEKVQSIVIDKDYTEWKVLQKFFSKSRILLCQFHVLKWFLRVVKDRKYALESNTRDAVLHILRSMVYAPTISSFNAQVHLLHELLVDKSPLFLKYMQERWYSIRPMWSNCERGSVFTALNTTSNRLEAAWNQIKKMLGRRLRIDLCVEAIFAYQTTVLRRELKLISRSVGLVMLRSRANPFIGDVCRDVSDYCARELMTQWDLYEYNSSTYATSVLAMPSSGDPHLVSVASINPGGSTHVVDCVSWSCSCAFSTTSGLPCRHVILTARDVVGVVALPIATVRPRWRMSVAEAVLPFLRRGIAEVQTLRTALAHLDSELVGLVEDGALGALSESTSGISNRKIANIRLRKRERSTTVIMDNLEKRQAVRSEVEQITALMMSFSTPVFRDRLRELSVVLSRLTAAWIGSDGESIDPMYDLDPLEDGSAVTAWVEEAMMLVQPDLQDSQDGDAGRVDDGDAGRVDDGDVDRVDDGDVERVDDGDADRVDAPVTTEAVGRLVRMHVSREYQGDAQIRLMKSEELGSMRVNATVPGTTRKQRAGVSALTRLAYVNQASCCPLTLVQFNWAARWFVGVGRLMDLWRRFPLRFYEGCLRGRVASVTMAAVDSRREEMNFTIPEYLWTTLTTDVAAHRAIMGVAPEQMEYIVTISDSVRAFSELNLVSIGEFYWLRDMIRVYSSDMEWVDGVARECEDQSLRCEATQVLSAAATLALNSKFVTSSTHTDQRIEIEWSDVLGHLAGFSHLTSEIMNFSALDLAGNFPDVCVFCASTLGEVVQWYPAPSSVQSARLVLFPVMVGRVRWCLIAAVRYSEADVAVFVYDPVAGSTSTDHNRLVAHWMTACEPIVRSWWCRDGLLVHFREASVLARPLLEDVEESGLCCLMQAHDLIHQRGVFNMLETVSKSQVRAGRLRTLWKIVYRSRREHSKEDEAVSDRMLDIFRVYSAREEECATAESQESSGD